MADTLTNRWINNASDEYAVSQGCYFDESAAERVATFFRKFLKHSKGEQWAGKPFELFDWQYKDIIAPLFGWMRDDGKRRFRISYIELPKKNGKSSLASGIGLYMLIGDNEPGAEIYSLACDRAQASIVHGEAIRMVEASSALSSYLRVNKTTSNIHFDKRQSWYRAWSSESETKEGANAHGLICDELHAWKGEPGRRLFNAVKWAGAARSQPLLFIITTAGDDQQGVCYEQREYAQAVEKGEVKDERFFTCIHAADPGDDWTKEETWRKANPALGQTISPRDFAAECEEAKARPSIQAAWKRYRLNIWTTASNPWLNIEDWNACRGEWSAEDLTGELCYGGLDLSKTRDFTAFSLVFPHDTEEKANDPFEAVRRTEQGEPSLSSRNYRAICKFWLPESVIFDPASPEEYRQWHAQGWITATPGQVLDYRFIRAEIQSLAEKYEIGDYAYDPYNAEQITQEIEDEVGLQRVLFPQTITHFTEPCKELERLIISKEIEHDGNPVLSWMIGNTSIKTDPNQNIRPVKPDRTDKRKIDGTVALVMALARAVESAGSVYEDGGIFVID